MSKLPVLSLEDRQLINDFEKGRRLREVVMSPGWQDVLDIFEAEVIAAENDLMRYAASDKDVISVLHRRARSKRELLDQAQVKINQMISNSERLPDELMRRSEGTSMGIPGINLD